LRRQFQKEDNWDALMDRVNCEEVVVSTMVLDEFGVPQVSNWITPTARIIDESIDDKCNGVNAMECSISERIPMAAALSIIR
jgi:hypothetical protein